MMRSTAELPFHHQEMVNRELESSERVVWAAMPRPKFFTPVAAGAFLFGIPWTAFAIFWTAAAAWGTREVEEGAGLFALFPLFGVPFILVGLCLLSSPIWAYRKALRTVYVITDRRAISFEGGRSTTIRSYPPDKLQDVYRTERGNRTGDVIIARRAWRDSDGDRQSEELGFLRIEEPKRVESLLKDLAKQSN